MVHSPFVGRDVGCCEYVSGAIVWIVIVFAGDWRFMFWYRDHIFAISRKPGKQQKTADDLTLELAKKHHCSFIELDKVGVFKLGGAEGVRYTFKPSIPYEYDEIIEASKVSPVGSIYFISRNFHGVARKNFYSHDGLL